jgi:very-short-patch-repair endonuclease
MRRKLNTLVKLTARQLRRDHDKARDYAVKSLGLQVLRLKNELVITGEALNIIENYVDLLTKT